MSSRREFLMQVIWLAALSRAMPAVRRHHHELGAAEFTASDLQMLGAAMEEIIPSDGGMPSAMAAGGLQYLRYLGWQYPNIQEEITRFLETLGHRSAARFGTEFPKLRPDERLRVLTAIEREEPAVFSSFVGYVYESYYTRPQVLGLISCPLPSAPMENEEELLSPVRKLVHPYREVQ